MLIFYNITLLTLHTVFVLNVLFTNGSHPSNTCYGQTQKAQCCNARAENQSISCNLGFKCLVSFVL